MKKLHLLVPILFLSMLACTKQADVTPFDDDLEGSFEFSISGSESRGLTGTSSFVQAILTSESDDENGSSLAINFYSEGEDTEVITVLINQPGDLDGINAGTYTVNLDQDEEHPLVNVGAFLETSISPFLGVSGNVKISKSMDQSVVGSISVSMDNQNGDIITMSGEFTARGFTQAI